MRRIIALAIIAGLAAGARAFGSAAEDGAVRSILDRWIAAQGGRARMAAVRSYELRETSQFGSDDSVINLHAVWTKQHHFRYEVSGSASMTLVQNWDGLIGWQGNDRLGWGLIPKDGPFYWNRYDDLLIGLELDQIWPKRRLLGDGEAGGRPCAVIGMTAADGIEERFYFDRADGQCLREERPDASERGTWITFDFSDFRTADGLGFAGTIKTTQHGLTSTVRRSAVLVDPPVDEATFILSTARLREIFAIDSILARNLAAVGGVDAISRIRSRITHAIIDSSEPGPKIRVTVSQKEPNLGLNETDKPGIGREWQGFDGTVGWASSEIAGFHLLKPAEVATTKIWGGLAQEDRLAERYPLRRMLGARLVNGRHTHAVALSTLWLAAGTYYFDDENGRLLRMTSIIGDLDGYYESTQDFSDFRRIDGVEKPYVITQTNPGGKSVVTITSMQDNVPLDDSIFKPRRDDW